MNSKLLLALICLTSQVINSFASEEKLPDDYFPLLESGISKIEERLNSTNHPTLAYFESRPEWKHFPNAIVVPAVLYTKKHPANKSFGHSKMLNLAIRIGDILVDEYYSGAYTARGDNDWDTYMWLEAYRLLQDKLDNARKESWKKILLEEAIVPLPRLSRSQDYPWYNAPFIGTSPNHFAIYASTILLAGHIFKNENWIKLSTKVLHRFCTEEQAPDGYWGEQGVYGPTTGYDFLTLTQIALYWEYSKDPAALNALRKSTTFHKFYTYPDGTPVETINDRNRFWGVSMWGHFGFSNFPDGRSYAEMLTKSAPKPGDKNVYGGDIQSLARIAQNVLYFHEGATGIGLHDSSSYFHQMTIPAGIRKHKNWVVTYSGIIAPPFSGNNFFLDRQASFSVFNEKTGLIISGANSKHQPELATFTEIADGNSLHMPISSRLKMRGDTDRLALSYNYFFAELLVPQPHEDNFQFQMRTTNKWSKSKAELNLQLVLKPGKTIKTGSGITKTLGTEKFSLDSKELGGSIQHNGWMILIPDGMTLNWPFYPFNPYTDSPETRIDRCVGRLSLPFDGNSRNMKFTVIVKNPSGDASTEKDR